MNDSSDRISTNIRKGVLEYCVLALLARREMYGLELAETLVTRDLIASEGSLYPLLARMRESGTVETRWESTPGGRPRRYYAITAAGGIQLKTFASIWGTISAHVETLVGEAGVGRRSDPPRDPISAEERS